ncbi:hypothetical protein BHE74_00034657 [Ensete ventricosum]|nr:hypothetical protein BHE74_00034657 [Ensete ventricosum]
METIPDICNKEILPSDSPWTCPGDHVFYDASVIWGLIGPRRIFGDLGTYSNINWFFLAGALAPVLVWFGHKAFPNQEWIRLINMPVLIGATGSMPPATAVNYITWIIVGFLSGYVVYRYRRDWWQRHNYVLSGALDAGLAFMGVLLYLCLGLENVNLSWPGNDLDGCPLASCPTAKGVVIEGCPKVIQFAENRTPTPHAPADKVAAGRVTCDNHLFVRSPPSPPLPRSATDELEALRLIVMAATATLGFVNLLLKPNGNRSSGCKPFPNSQPPCLTRLPSALRPHLPSPALPLLSNAPSIPTAAAAAAAVAVSLPLFFHPQVSSLLLRLFLYPLIAVEVMAFLGWKDALAVDGEFGILEGRTIALVHPVVMGGLFVYTLWAGYLGWQWRRVRTIQNEINDLKQAAPAAPMTVAARSDAEASPPASPSPAEAKIQQLTEVLLGLLFSVKRLDF